MPLTNPFRRQSETPAPTLRDRAADLSTRLASAIRRPRPETAAEPEAKSNDTIEGFASLGFAAYTLDEPMKTPQEWADRFAAHAVMMHVADRTLRMTKPELIAFIRDAGERSPETPEIMFQGLDGAQETFEGWGNLLSLSRARYIVAASAACTEPTPDAEASAASPHATKPAEGGTSASTDLAAICDQAITDWNAIQPKSRAESWGDEQLDEALDAYGAVFKRAIREPSGTLSETQAKARLLLHDLREHQGRDEDEKTDDKRLMRVVLREVAALCAEADSPSAGATDFGPDAKIAELAAEFCRAYASHAEADRASLAGEITEAEWDLSYRACVALMERLEASQPKTILGMALKCLGPIGAAGWNAKLDGSTDGMDQWERVGAQFQDALKAGALAPFTAADPRPLDLLSLIDLSSASMKDLRSLHDLAYEVGNIVYGMAWTGRCSGPRQQGARSVDDYFNPAGTIMQELGDALTVVEAAAFREAKSRTSLTAEDRKIRLELIARGIIQNGDHAETAVFARELLASVEK